LKTVLDRLIRDIKDESDRLNALMAKLPAIEDLRQTLETEIAERDPQKINLYTRSFNKDFLQSTKQNIAVAYKK